MSNRRREPRYRVYVDVELADETGRIRKLEMVEISSGGCQLFSTKYRLPLGTFMTLGIGPFREIQACVVWQRGDGCGVRFDRPLQRGMVDHVRKFLDAGSRDGSAA